MTINKAMNIAAIVPAAGIGSRMKSSLPKQYLKINNKTVLEHTLAKLADITNISEVCVAISPEDTWFKQLNLDLPNLTQVLGGKERADTVLNALQQLKQSEKKYDWVLVHDAARPLVDADDIYRLIEQVQHHDKGGILAAKVKDTIKQSDANSCQAPQLVKQTVPRDDLWQALTPQLFKFDQLFDALSAALQQGVKITDEASAIEWANLDVLLVEGRSDNIKITTPEDLQLAQFYLSQQTT